MLAPKDDNRPIVKFTLGSGFVEELRPHQYYSFKSICIITKPSDIQWWQKECKKIMNYFQQSAIQDKANSDELIQQYFGKDKSTLQTNHAVFIKFQTQIILNFQIEFYHGSQMDKFNVMAVNHLLSFDKADQIAKMTKQQKLIFNNEIKKQAAYFMLSVSRAVQNKDYKTAKSILIYIADSCSCIEDPDFQVRYLIEVCCQHLAYIREMEGVARDKNNAETRTVQIKSQLSQTPILVFKYNKFKGEFQCDQQNKSSLNQTVLFYMSKLNAILFNFQNSENHHSIVTMLMIYYPQFLMVFILMFILFIIIFSGVLQLIEDGSSILQSQIPVVFVCSMFIYPLVKIFLKKPINKDSAFFKKKLGEQILKINKYCLQNNENIKFFMPQGVQINVQINYNPSNKNVLDNDNDQ